MINNILKVVGVDSSSNDNSNATSFANPAASSTQSSYYTANIVDDANNAPNLASTIGGIFSTFQETFQLDGKGGVDAGGGGGAIGISGGVGIGFGRSGGGRSKNTSGRGYYTDVIKRRDVSSSGGMPQLLSGIGVGGGSVQQQEGKPNHDGNSRPVFLTNGVYQGRKIVSDVNHLYDIVNDRDAHENYDSLMDIISTTNNNNHKDDYADDTERFSDYSGDSDRGSRRGHQGHEKSLEQKLIWARLKEEEIVDRMLSQFPEFGTNLPTPFTAMDDDDDDDTADDRGEFNNRQLFPRSNVANANITSSSQKNVAIGSNTTIQNSPTIRSFTEDASDIIGRFFFGMPNSGGHDPPSSYVGGSSSIIGGTRERDKSNASLIGDKNEFQRTSSYTSMSSMSTMTASASTSRALASLVDGRTNNDKQPESEGSKHDTDTLGDKLDDGGTSSGWDQDEIDLWATSSASPETSLPRQPIGEGAVLVSVYPGNDVGSQERKSFTTAPISNASTVQRGLVDIEGLNVEDNWVSRRRLYRERFSMRQDWNALKDIPRKPYPSTTIEQPALIHAEDTPSILPVSERYNEHPSKSSQLYETGKSRDELTLIVDNDKQHWMPDSKCKQCYTCEAPFTLIRRKHHCRLCGMIFCSVCSAYFVPISSPATDTIDGGNIIVSSGLPSSNKRYVGAHGTMRTCKLCYDYLSERGMGSAIRANALDNGGRSVTETTSTARPVSSFESSAHQLEGNRSSSNNAIFEGGGEDQPNPDASNTPLLESSSGIKEAILELEQSKNEKLSAKIHIGTVASDYLEKLTRELLTTDAPLLLEEIKTVCAESSTPLTESQLMDLWVNNLMTLATRCCSVEPDVKNGDFLDIRPYCKVKVIPGGYVKDSAYISGILFHKNVSHKKMAKVIMNAKIMMLSGGIEYTRSENRIASLETLIEQEERYIEILILKISKLKPDILIVGKSVCRKAQELLLRANIVLIQYVKPTLMTRISRQTGATVLASIDHITNSNILGRCRRFRLISFRDNDVWVDDNISNKIMSSDPKSVPFLLSGRIPNHERQAALAAQKLGEQAFDGMRAVKSGLAKRGVVQTYSMIEGCAKELGCTVVLRGASRQALKMVKRVFRFLINCSYNMKLETSYILERCCRLPPTYVIPQTPCCSSSLCVDFGIPPSNRKARPWNGGKNDPTQRSLSGKITPLDHQAILITSVWMTEKNQCCPAEVKGICYYSMQDVSLGQFLRDSCFNLSLKCQNPSCKKSVLDHSLSFIHNDGMINITVERMDNPIPTSSLKKQGKDSSALSDMKSDTTLDHEPIATWTFCIKCNQVVTPLTFLSNQTWQWSFGKFLEVYFYNRDAVINAPGHLCSCRMQTSSQLFFGCRNLCARFTYEKISPYSVFCRRHLPFDESFHRANALQDLEHITATSLSLFLKYDKQIDTITRETRELFGSAINKPEHLQAVLSELNLVSAEVDIASKVLQEKIASVAAMFSKPEVSKRAEQNETLLYNFPWYSRRYIFMLASAWNERLSAAGSTLTAMKKIQSTGGSGRGDSTAPPVAVGDSNSDDVVEGIKRIRMLQEVYSRNYNVSKMTMSRSGEVGLFEGNILPDGRVATWEDEAEIDDEEFYSDPENDIDFEDDIDADVLASRNRMYSQRTQSSSKRNSRQNHKNTASSKRNCDRKDECSAIYDQSQTQNSLVFPNNSDSSSQLEFQGKVKTVTAGGAVKSALTKFFNRGGSKEDPYVVDLGFFGKGRPRLQPGIGGLVIPVFDDQPSTIISHSLASAEYDVQFKHFLSAVSQPESKSDKYESSRSDIERRMLGRNKSHIKHTFRDFDEKGQQLCKFVCTTFWAVQFDAVRQAFMNPQASSKDTSVGDGMHGSAKTSGTNKHDFERSYIRSLATSFSWAASGGKSGATFSRTADDRLVIKSISRTELQMFLDCAPAYFEYLNKAFFHGLPTVLCKIVGVYQIGYHNRVTGRRTMEQVAVMQNIFYKRKISKIFDLKGSLRGRFTRQANANKDMRFNKKSSKYRTNKFDSTSESDSDYSEDEDDDDTVSTSSGGPERDDSDRGEKIGNVAPSIPTLLDGDFLEFTSGRPLPLTDRAKAVFHMSILNDTLFLSIINVLDYSILVGIDEEKMELVVGIIDFMRQYDILKQMERVGKSLPMVVGSEAPTIIQPPLYKTRFTNAMERYFMTVPSKWTTV